MSPSTSFPSLTTFNYLIFLLLTYLNEFLTFLLVNNAGFVLGVDKVGNIDDSEIDAMISTNIVGLISVTQLLVKGELFCLAIRSDMLL